MTRYAASMDNAAENLEGATRFLAHMLRPGVATGLVVSQKGAGANMSVDISTGDGFIPKTNYGPWAWSDAVENLTIGGASASNRHDAIVAYIDFSVSNPSTSTPNNPGALKFAVVQGTPSGSPVDPSGATIQAAIGATYPYIVIASVLVLSTDTTIVTARITNYNIPVALALAYIWAGNLNTIGHQVPNVADDIFSLLAAVQSFSNKTISGTTNKVRAGGAASSLVDTNNQQIDFERATVEGGQFNFVVSGCVWTADSAGSTLLASMTSGVVRINGRRLTVAAVVSRAFTASKDTYVDFQDNGDGTASLSYQLVNNNAGSPALANSGTDTNTLRNAIIVTGASNIAAAGSINQGQEDRVLPIVSSIPYTVTDSLGFLICPRDPNRRVLGYRQVTTGSSVSSGTYVALGTPLSVPVNVPANGRKVKITVYTSGLGNTVAANNAAASIWDGAVSGGSQLNEAYATAPSASGFSPCTVTALVTPAAGLKTYNAGALSSGGTTNFRANSTAPAYILVENY